MRGLSRRAKDTIESKRLSMASGHSRTVWGCLDRAYRADAQEHIYISCRENHALSLPGPMQDSQRGDSTLQRSTVSKDND